jgi:hypothetical protein
MLAGSLISYALYGACRFDGSAEQFVELFAVEWRMGEN